MSNGMKTLGIIAAGLVLGALFSGIYGSGWMGFNHHGSGHHDYESYRDTEEHCNDADEECEMEDRRGIRTVGSSCH